jgi:hypothetical protein
VSEHRVTDVAFAVQADQERDPDLCKLLVGLKRDEVFNLGVTDLRFFGGRYTLRGFVKLGA